jgi:hypothetical protein
VAVRLQFCNFTAADCLFFGVKSGITIAAAYSNIHHPEYPNVLQNVGRYLAKRVVQEEVQSTGSC